MIEPQRYDYLFGNLRGISDRALAAHLELYRRAVEKLNAIDAAYPLVEWMPEGASVGKDAPTAALLVTPVASLKLEIIGPLAECVLKVEQELGARLIAFRPEWYLGTSDEDFWTTDRGVSVNIPWCFANPALWRLANRASRTAYSTEEMLRTLRHEAGHAICYAFGLWTRPEWKELFGESLAPYKDDFTPEEGSRDHVEYLTGVKAHYAQKHPDEDWAEAFACWLDPASNWAEQYAEWPGALKKLQYVDELSRSGDLSGPAPNPYVGRREPYTMVKGTVAQVLGIGKATPTSMAPGPWSEHGALLRAEPAAYNSVVLHEAHFGALGGPPVPHLSSIPNEVLAIGDPFIQAVVGNWGTWQSYLLDLRLICAATDGWALTVWDERRKQVRNAMIEGGGAVPAGCDVLLALDTAEHAYALDYGIAKHLGIAAQFENVEWLVPSARLEVAVAPMVVLPTDPPSPPDPEP